MRSLIRFLIVLMLVLSGVELQAQGYHTFVDLSTVQTLTAKKVFTNEIDFANGIGAYGIRLLSANGARCLRTDPVTKHIIEDINDCGAAIEQAPPPPFPPPSGQYVAWAYPESSNWYSSDGGTFVPESNGWAINGIPWGIVAMTGSCGLCNQAFGVHFYNYAMPALPNDAVIQGIYSTIVAKKVGSSINTNLGCSVSGVPNDVAPWEGEFFGTSLGTTSGVVTSFTCNMELRQSLTTSNTIDKLYTYFTALAVYYTSATPPTTIGTLLQVPGQDYSRAFVSIADASPISLFAAGNPQPAYFSTLNHVTATRALNVSGMVSGGIYTFQAIQDATGGAALTLGTGCTWLTPAGAAASASITTTANAVTTLRWLYDGTRCIKLQ